MSSLWRNRVVVNLLYSDLITDRILKRIIAEYVCVHNEVCLCIPVQALLKIWVVSHQHQWKWKFRRILYKTSGVPSTKPALIPQLPRDADDEYIATNPKENLPSTMRTHASRLIYLVDWCEDKVITNLTELTTTDLTAVKRHQSEQGLELDMARSRKIPAGVALVWWDRISNCVAARMSPPSL